MSGSKLTKAQRQVIYAALVHYIEDSSLGEDENYQEWEGNCTEIRPLLKMFEERDHDAT